MSIARRPAKCRIACLRCAAQNRPPLQRWSMPPFSRAPRCRTPGSGRGMRKLGTYAARARRSSDADHLGNHVAGAAHDHRVADAHVLAPQLVQVVQRGVADRGAADEHRLELGHRRQLAGAADLDLDVVQPRQLLLRRVLVRHRPARLARDEAQPLLQRAVVDLVDHAVDVEGQRVALGRDLLHGRPPARRRPAPRAGRRSPAGPRPRARRASRCAWAAAPSPATSPRP